MTDDIKCPICGGKTTLRTRRSDKLKFYVCANFPKCKGMVAQDEVYWEEEEPNPVKSEPSKKVAQKEVKQIESTGKGGVKGLAVGLFCGIVTLISFFIPWTVGSVQAGFSSGGLSFCHYNVVNISGWTALTTPDNLDSSFPYPYFVLAGAIMMIVFALIAVVTVLSTRNKAVKGTLGWLAMMSSLISVVASVWAMFSISSMARMSCEGPVTVPVLSGLTLCAVFSSIGLIGFLVALAGFNKPEKQVQPQGES